jgi:hypothetical protein
MHALDQQWCRALGNYSAPAHGAGSVARNGIAVRNFDEKSRSRARPGFRAIRTSRGANAAPWARYVRLARQVWLQVWAA